MGLARGFCTEYRLLLASVFKRSGGVGLMGRESRSGGRGGNGERGGGEVEKAVRELSDVLVMLVTTCGWLEEDENRSGPRRAGPMVGLFS